MTSETSKKEKSEKSFEERITEIHKQLDSQMSLFAESLSYLDLRK